ncbi:MAG: glucoamylase family protein [Patescibacteria group bacterium]
MSDLLEAVNLKKIDKLASDLSKRGILFSKPKPAESFFNNLQKKVRSTYKLYNNFIKSITSSSYLTQEAELVDNFYIIENAISDIENGIVKKEFLKLPQISKSGQNFVPRTYFIFSELLKANKNEIDKQVMEKFINSYQKHTPLTLRELYATPTILKIILVENIQYLIERILLSSIEFNEAEFWFKQIIKKTKQKRISQFSEIIHELTSKYNIIPVNFGFYLLQRLSHYEPVARPVTKWLKSNLLKQGIDIKDLAKIEGDERDKRRVLISNIFESLRWLNQVQWGDFVGNVNVVDKIFHNDPAGVYTALDDRTKNLYKDAVVRVADVTGIHEAEIAKHALKLTHSKKTESGQIEDDGSIKAHIGHYLIGQGRDELEKKFSYKPTFFEKYGRLLLNNPSLFYFTSISLVCLSISALVSFYVAQYTSGLYLALTAVLIFILSSEVGTNLLNSLIVSFLPIKSLPKFDFKNGVPDEFRTFVVTSGMFRNISSINELLRRLEVNYLSNKDKNIFFGLLMDFTDALEESMPKDRGLTIYVSDEINKLNKKYSNGERKFFLFYRKRLWNPKENVFMGWERKRGKLREFNQLIRGSQNTTYIIDNNKFSQLPRNIKYVITLDEDTRMPKESASQLIGCIAHPLNRAILDEKTNVVRGGYGIIQPRVSTSLKTSNKSLFSKFFSSASGIDSYSSVVADVYQDLFKSGIFFGKGIYDIDIFEKTMAGKIPDNTVLSHDLLEGLYARAGLATDIQLSDDFPSQYHEYVSRLHRWTRGDWQIIDWLFPRVRLGNGTLIKNEFSFVSRWKIFDNLRRSSIPIVSLAFLLLSWGLSSPNMYWGSVYIIIILSSPFIFSVCIGLLKWERSSTLKNKISSFINESVFAVVQVLVSGVFLFYNAGVAISAIVSTFIHKYLTRKHMLRWQSSGEVAKKLKGTLLEIYSTMWFTQAGSLLLISIFININASAFPIYIWSVLWILSPLIAYGLGRPRPDTISFMPKERELLRHIACKSSRYFLEFTNAENNWLIPDHFQEEKTLIASNNTTSPTNIGMGLLSLLSAYDFGYIGISELKTRLTNTFNSLNKLERYQGHFYNWYDIKLLKPLIPQYVSSVDSANFLASIITLKQGILDILKKPTIGENVVQGLSDILVSIAKESSVVIENIRRDKTKKHDNEKVEQLNKIINSSSKALNSLKQHNIELTLSGFEEILFSLSDSSHELKKLITEMVAVDSKENMQDIYYWIQNLENLISLYRKETRDLFSFSKIVSDFPAIHKLKRYKNFSIKYEKLLHLLNQCPTLLDLKESRLSLAVRDLDIEVEIESYSLEETDKESVRTWFLGILEIVEISEQNASKLFDSYNKLVVQCDKIFEETDFRFLYNKERGLFHIGYNATFNKIDSSYYDFLASETNIISFIAVLKNQAPKKHWFHLNRKFVKSGSNPVLYSWGGSLFEHVTSLIFLDVTNESLLGKNARAAVKAHISYAKKYGIPWGMGESAYNLLNANKNYEYQTFGVPNIGLKRSLGDYLVVAPYTTVLSLLFEPKNSIKNLEKLMFQGGVSSYGFYDAIDYTPSKERKRGGVATKVYYAHHQGFIMSNLNNALNDKRIRKLFNEDPLVASVEVLLEEKVRAITPVKPTKITSRLLIDYSNTTDSGHLVKQYIPLRTQTPRFAFLSNGNYSVSISNTGCGYSKYNNLLLTRFKEDAVLEGSGTFLYVRNLDDNSLWSPTFHPTKVLGKNYKVIFSENKAEFYQTNKGIDTILKISVPPEDNVEIRELTITNQNEFQQSFEVSSYGEVVLASQGEDIGHPAYQRLFIKSEFLKEHKSLVFTRNNLPDKTKKFYFAHFMADNKVKNEVIKYNTSRESFLGRRGSTVSPYIFNHEESVSHDKDYTLDSIFSLQKKINLKPNESTKIIFINAYSTNLEDLTSVIKKYRNLKNPVSIIDKANQESVHALKRFGISSEQALIFQELASRILAGGYLRDKPTNVSPAFPMIHSLWKYGISGDTPIIVVKIKDIEDINFIKNVLLCYRYLTYKGLNIDIVIYNEHPGGYIKTLHDEIDFIIRYNKLVENNHSNGKVFHLKTNFMSVEDRHSILFNASAIFDSEEGNLEYQIKTRNRKPNIKPLPNIFKSSKELPEKEVALKPSNSLSFYNGLGGFDETKKEYVMHLSQDLKTPASWVNVISNPQFGFMVSEGGSSHTWSVDSYDNRLTSWAADSLLDASGEILYIRDEKTGELWSPTPYPLGEDRSYTVKHGRGYSTFEHKRGSLEHKLLMFVPTTEKIKIFKLTIKNTGTETRNLSVTGFFELVLGVNYEQTKRSLITSTDNKTKAVITQNIVRNHFQGNLVFLDMNKGNYAISTSREEFFGRGGSVKSPEALKKEKLSNEIKYEPDHSVSLQTVVNLKSGEEKSVLILLGEGENIEEIRKLVTTYRKLPKITEALAQVERYWDQISRSITISTPDESLDIMFNDWILYQILSSRIFTKAGYSQPSGAFGFRDQLQDITAFIYSNPDLVRKVILDAAEHQFVEGDVQTWWHEHNNFGMRSVMSDHQLWLPHIVCSYVEITGDFSIFDERMPFLEGPALDFKNKKEWVGVPEITKGKYSLFEHCTRAIDKSLFFGEHGLPLIGKGDWNDGFNEVGINGKGESVWSGFFLYSILTRFSEVCTKLNDVEHLDKYRNIAESIKNALEIHGWDGSWYRRAYFDDGAPLGSHLNEEIKIDSITQSWAVLSRAGTEERAREAMDAVEKYLMPDKKLLKLLAPPIAKSSMRVGYTGDYPPGVRENGSQYNHAALWVAQAFATLGEGDKAKNIIDLINPINRSRSPEGVTQYRVEPYVVASDIYSKPSYEGRGGWTWYTGAAGLMYRTTLEFILGIKISKSKLIINPCIPKDWKEFKVSYFFKSTSYKITVKNPLGLSRGVKSIAVNGKMLDSKEIILSSDGKIYNVEVIMGD